MSKRVLLMVLALALALLAAEGASSLLAGRTLADLWTSYAAEEPALRRPDAERFAAGTPGPFAVHPDPRVGNAMRPGFSSRLSGVAFHTDKAGLRARPQGPVPADALRIVVLGDSVAFGSGVADDETLAHRLERFLDQARDAGSRPVACLTVAAPGWNHRNATGYLVDHYAELAPDIVVFVSVENDLSDTFGVTSGGKRRAAADLASDDPWLSVTTGGPAAFLRDLQQRRGEAGLPAPEALQLGPLALVSDLSIESRRRFDENAASLLGLQRLLERQGGRLLLLHFQEDSFEPGFTWILRERLLEAGFSAREVRGFTRPPRSLRLPRDAHPNREGQRMLALWVAHALLRSGWVEGRPEHLPEERNDAFRAAIPTPASIRREAAAARARARQQLRPRIDLSSGEGSRQVYGGLNPDGSMGPRLLAVLSSASSGLLVRLSPVRSVTQLYPLRVEVRVDGVPVGGLEVPVRGVVEARFAWPGAGQVGAAVEVGLAAETWAVARHRGRSQLVSCEVLFLGAAGR